MRGAGVSASMLAAAMLSAVLLVAVSAPAASAQPGAAQQDAAADPADEPAAAASAESAAAPEDPAGMQELGGQVGMEMGGRVSPGGFHVLGSYLYRLSDVDWFEGGLSVTVGGGGAGCFRDREDDFLCDHSLAHGFGLEALAGVRRFFAGQGKFSPFARGAIGVRVVSFGADDVSGLAIPLILGGGIRARVADHLAVVGGADLRLGVGWFSRDLGSEPHLTLAVHAGVEFRL